MNLSNSKKLMMIADMRGVKVKKHKKNMNCLGC